MGGIQMNMDKVVFWVSVVIWLYVGYLFGVGGL